MPGSVALSYYVPLGHLVLAALLDISAGRPPATAPSPPAAGATQAQPSSTLCRGNAADGTIVASLVAAPVRPADSTARVALCLAKAAGQPAIGSLRGVVTYDSSAARVLRVDRGAQGGPAANTGRAGLVQFAAASSQGIASGQLMALTLSLAKRGSLPPIRLEVVEVSDVRAANLSARVRVVSLGPPDCVANAQSSLRLTSMTPATGEAGAVISVTLTGCGFDATRNTVVFGQVTIADVPSTQGGTRIEFPVPMEVRSRSEVPPMVIGAGSYPVSVRTARGTSNALVFTLR